MSLVLVGAFLLAGADSLQGPVLGVDGARFTLDGRPAFLLGCSYYGALGVEDETVIARDLGDLATLGFNWIRVWVTWNAFENNVTAVAPDGAARPPYLDRLKRLCHMAGEHGMVVDVTVTRGDAPDFPTNYEQHSAVMITLARELLPFRNVYFDVGNERNVGDARYVPMEEVGRLIRAIKTIDPKRLCTASQGGDISREEVIAYINEGEVDFLTPHRPRGADSPAQTAEKTREYLDIMKEARRIVPVHYQEPFRRGYGDYPPKAEDFLTDLSQAREGGAAGWCFHNGSVRGDDGNPEQRPRRSFDMRPAEGRLFDQIDDVEQEFLRRLKESSQP
ncbi:MAG: hypothetical protein IT365_22500 [Candidatus Hydrogenedentes bacterium]|nr:hypothetical protein [Candidatus Hydrogenedentota bacterium]